GARKVTTQKFYRINGGSTQLAGVKSDVIVPDKYSYTDMGEKDQENPLPCDKIEAAPHKQWSGYIDYDLTIQKSKERMAKNPQPQLIDQNAKWIKEQQEEKVYPLNIEDYKLDAQKDEEAVKRFRQISEYQTDLSFTSLAYEKELMAQDTILKEKRNRWHANLSKDVYIEEAIHVLQDLKLSTMKTGKVAKIRD